MQDKVSHDYKLIWDKRYNHYKDRAAIGINTDTKTFNPGGMFSYKRIKEIAGDRASGTVIDLGCGSGRISQFFPMNCEKLYCLDVSDVAIISCKQRTSGENVIFSSPEEMIRIPENSVDLIFFLQVAYHIPILLSFRYMKISHKILKEGGMLIFDHCNIHDKIYDGVIMTRIETQDWFDPLPMFITNSDDFVRISKLIGYKSVEVKDRGKTMPWIISIK